MCKMHGVASGLRRGSIISQFGELNAWLETQCRLLWRALPFAFESSPGARPFADLKLRRTFDTMPAQQNRLWDAVLVR